VFTNFGGTSISTSQSVDGSSFLNFDFMAEIARAFALWSTYGDIEFMQVEDSGGAAGSQIYPDIRIFFGPFPGQYIGRAFFPSDSGQSAVAGDILLENLRSFNASRDFFFNLVLHEIGHAIGLEHTDAASIMQPIIYGGSVFTSYDKTAIQAVYGPQDNRPPVYDMPSDQKTINILDAPNRVTVNGNNLSNLIDGAKGHQAYSGAGGQDTILGRGGNDTLSGDGGNDRLNGGSGNDRMNGGSGNDVIIGAAGNDTLSGSSGRDNLSGSNGNDRLNGGAGPDVLRGGSGADTASGNAGNDRLFGGTGRDSLLGNNGNDTLRGNDGNDVLNGGAQADDLQGNKGADLLIGGAGSDKLVGGEGRDTLNGGAGNDTMSGGGGGDTFVFRTGHGQDVINDFNALNSAEKLDFRGLGSISNITQLRAKAEQVGDDVVINTGGGNSITLRDVELNTLGADDFIF
jgi:Ca2+-binding RTX toxin-like protein